MMKILYLASEFHWCGASISFLNLLKGLKSKDVEMLVVVPNTAPVSVEFVNKLFDMGIRYFQIPLPWEVEYQCGFKDRLKKKTKNLIKYILHRSNPYLIQKDKSKQVLKALIKEYHPDIVHTNVGVFHEGFEVCQELGIPHVWHLRDYHDLDFHWMPLPSWKVYKQQLKQSDAVITITNDIKKHYGLWDSPNAYTIYNGCFDAGDVAMDFPKENYFFSASRIVEAKGHDDTVRAFDMFYQNHKDFKLVLAGIGENHYIDHLKELISRLSCRDAVELIGHQQDVRPWMCKAKALVVASYNEGFGRMTAEAAFCGCLVIGRNTGGTKEILDQIGGFSFENEDAINGIYKRMEDVVNLSEKQYLTMAERAQNKAVSLYSNESYVEKVYTVYKKLMGDSVCRL